MYRDQFGRPSLSDSKNAMLIFDHNRGLIGDKDAVFNCQRSGIPMSSDHGWIIDLYESDQSEVKDARFDKLSV